MALNNRMKEVQKAALSDEKHTIQLLQRIYEQAAKDTEAKIAALNARTDLQNIQSIVYQKQYQEALKKQLDGIINDLHTQSFTTVSEYLGKSYEHGFYGTLYDLHGQGVPFLFPIRQDEVAKALNNDYSNIAKNQRGKDIYKRMGENTDYLKKAVRAEVSRGIANGSSWLDMASHVAKGMNSPFNRAMKRAFLITRTEGHRVQNQATVDVQKRAKALGADIVKQWDATLDANTRPWHADADGQIREIDEEFDVGGEKMKAPGIGGSARNVCNCRCVLLQRAKWALNKNETRYLGDVSSMTDKQKEDIAKKLGVSVDDLPNISKSIVPIHATDYNEFKEKAQNVPIQKIIDDFVNGKSTDRKALGERILKEYGVDGVPVNIKDMADYGYCSIRIQNGKLTVTDYNLNARDKRSIPYQIKTAFHEAYHASGNGFSTDIDSMDQSRWLDLEETFAESSAHYMVSQYGITELAPSYPDKLVKMLPRLKKLPEFKGCKTIADFGKVAQEARQNGGGSVWKDMSQRAMRKKFDFATYTKQYFQTIRKDIPGMVDKILENMPESKQYRKDMIDDLTKAMDNVDTYGFPLGDNQSLMLNNAVAVEMGKMGVL